MAYIFGVRIDEVSLAAALARVKTFLNSQNRHTIFTPNPEMLVDACRDKNFCDILNSSSLNICDGKGIQLVSKKKLERITGIDFMIDICALAEKEGKSIYLLGSGDNEVVEKTFQKLSKRYPRLLIAGADKGPVIDNKQNNNVAMKQYNNESKLTVDYQENAQTIKQINLAQPDILFVAFGHGKQEIWIHENLAKMPSVKVAMGVGGAFDYVSGKVSRAPCWMRKIGLEWMYRLIKQPTRAYRILKATIIFSILLLYQNLKNKNQNDN